MNTILVDSSVWISWFRDNRPHPALDILIHDDLICTNDLILADQVLTNNLILYSEDRHFKLMQQHAKIRLFE